MGTCRAKAPRYTGFAERKKQPSAPAGRGHAILMSLIPVGGIIATVRVKITKRGPPAAGCARRAGVRAMHLTLCVFTAAVLFGVSAGPAAAGQRSPCQVPANVVVDNVSALPPRDRARVFADWRKVSALTPAFESDWGGGRGSDLDPSRGEPLVIMPAGTAIGGSPREWLFAYKKISGGRRRPATIESVTVNSRPRRIVFVAENGADVTPAARTIESAVITGVISKARPDDSFALLTAGGPRVALRFGSSRAELLAAVKGLGETPPSAAKSEGVRDALLETTTWFHAHQAGDAIFALTMGLEGPTPGFFGTLRNAATLNLMRKHQASFSQLRAAILRAHIRVFGIQLGHDSYNPAACPVSMCGATVRPDESNAATYFGSGAAARLELLDLCAMSFGQFASTDTERAGYKLTASLLVRLKSDAETMYQAASEFYVLGLTSTGTSLVIGLKPDVQDRFPWSYVFYPQNIPACSSK